MSQEADDAAPPVPCGRGWQGRHNVHRTSYLEQPSVASLDLSLLPDLIAHHVLLRSQPFTIHSINSQDCFVFINFNIHVSDHLNSCGASRKYFFFGFWERFPSLSDKQYAREWKGRNKLRREQQSTLWSPVSLSLT